jgi:hypothetical protein
MKKWILALAFLLFTIPAFAAVATVTATEYGYEITGGTSATVINAGTLYVRQIAFSANSIGDTAAVTSGASNLSCMNFKAVTATDSANNKMFFTEKTPFANLSVTLSATTDILYVYLQ